MSYPILETIAHAMEAIIVRKTEGVRHFLDKGVGERHFGLKVGGKNLWPPWVRRKLLGEWGDGVLF